MQVPSGHPQRAHPPTIASVASEPELVKPPASLAGLRELSAAALLAMVGASLIGVLDGIGSELVLIPLLAIPPVIAAMSASPPETGVVGAFCLILAALSGTWNENFDQSEYLIGLLTVIGGAVAGLWVASLRAHLGREQAASELLSDAGQLMESVLDQKERALQLAKLAVPTLADVSMVDILAPDGQILRLAAWSGGSEVADLFIRLRADVPIDPRGPHPVAEVIRTGEPQLLDQLSYRRIEEITNKEEERQALFRHRFRSCLLLPLGARGHVLGCLTLWITQPANAFDEIARRTAKRLADRAALALDNARLHEQQAHIASVLQNSLRPASLPEIAGFESSSRFLAAGESHQVGGDFYDVFRTGAGGWTVVIGDVCGKGPEAASLTALARQAVRAASSPESTPSEVLRALHDSITAERTDLRFCTAALARIQGPQNGRGAARLTVALGGHPPPLILRKSGRVYHLGQPGTLLGALPTPSVADVHARLSLGDSLVLYTDGLLDLGDRSDDDDPDWLARQLAEAAGEGASEVASKLAEAAIKRQAGNPRDDIAILVLRRRGAG
jgi:serine phosphatase RsbU (regulator of sigma subunit)